jgi:hypothetical protein
LGRGRRNGERAGKCGGKFGEEFLGRIIRESWELGGEDEGSAKNCFCGGEVGKLMGGCSESQKEKRKVGNPIRGSTASCEGGFEAAVGPFNHSIGLRMESSCVNVGNLEEGGEGRPKGGSELGTSV